MGIIIGIAMILMGLIFAMTPPESYSTETADYASFGADYYTYQYEATKIVARNAAVTANNIRELGEELALYFGVAFMFAGALVVVNYGKKAGEVKAENRALALAAKAEAETETEAVNTEENVE